MSISISMFRSDQGVQLLSMWEDVVLLQLLGQAHVGPLRGETILMYLLRTNLYNEWKHAQTPENPRG